ncbi:MAG: YfhO family protein [Aggregatilineales bacterium]
MTIRNKDALAVLTLAALWLMFFWRLFTPVVRDQASLKLGDFSGQFVAFGGYQYARLSAGELPLWNPYNNGGLPFIADTQAAVFYPPRLATIALANLSGVGWTYHALQLEMTAHVLAYSLLMYALARRITLGQRGSVFGGLVAAVVAAYGGYLAGYPPLQLAILETGIWLPLALLGVLEATRAVPLRWPWFALGGAALGLSWLAGHPQTSYFLTCLMVSYCAYRVYRLRQPWTRAAMAVVFFGAVAVGASAVTLLPGLEYLPLTARVDYTFEAKSNGFPFRDVVQAIVPGIMSLFSPLYAGVVGLALAAIALWRRLSESAFWAAAALIALGLSFGAGSALYPALYNLLPGLRYFRGQERAAYIVANSIAVLAGLGAAHIAAWDRLNDFKDTRRIQQGMTLLLLVLAFGAMLTLLAWFGDSEQYERYLNALFFSALIAALALLTLSYALANPNQPVCLGLLLALLVFELFSVNMDSDRVYDPIPPAEQLSTQPPPLVAQALADPNTPFRVDGFRGLTDNYGSLYGLADMRGISPLFLDSLFRIIEPEKINPIAWELFAVRYVYSDWEQLPVESEIVGRGTDRYGPVNLHRLTNPRPYAHLVYQAEIVDNDAFARALLADPNFNPRTSVILDTAPGLNLPAVAPNKASARVTDFAPEAVTVAVDTPENAVLTLAHPAYPGWEARLDGQPVPILRAYGGLSAVAVPAGSHTISMAFVPRSFAVGAALSFVTWAALGILTAAFIVAQVRWPSVRQ